MFRLTAPCRDCPFLRTNNLHLGEERVREILHQMIDQHAPFFCHKTLNHDVDDLGVTEQTQHCAGAAIFLYQSYSMSLPMRLAAISGRFNPDALSSDAPVFSSKEEMIEHYKDTC